jgi:SAM-dependent methyltransferase
MDRPMANQPSDLARKGVRQARRAVRQRLDARSGITEAVKPVKRSFTAPPNRSTDPTERCLVCGSRNLKVELLSRPDKDHTINAICCERCRYVAIPDNHRDYHASDDTKTLGGARGARMGTWEVPGREFGMAKLGVQILSRQNTSVLMYGAGQSIDCHHAANLTRVGRVAIGDLVKTRNDIEFINTTNSAGAGDKFDVVVASEVLEHFPDPYPNMENLFSFVKDDGIVVCGTNIRDAMPMAKNGYMWVGGHVSYWSPKSLRIIARTYGMHLDFRVPACAAGRTGPRKKYIMFSRSQPVMESLADYFGSHMYAPSEPADATKHENPSAIPDGPFDSSTLLKH